MIQVDDDFNEPDEMEIYISDDESDTDEDNWQNNVVEIQVGSCTYQQDISDQIFYICKTCNDYLNQNIYKYLNIKYDNFEIYSYGFICSECARNCHLNHNVFYIYIDN